VALFPKERSTTDEQQHMDAVVRSAALPQGRLPLLGEEEAWSKQSDKSLQEAVMSA
jgi:hypothetical protein